MLQTFTLPNGIRVATYHLPHLKSFHLRASVKGGSLVENKKNSGVSHFMEHMLVQGIPSLPTAEAFSRYVEGIAGSYGAYTERMTISFYLTVPATQVVEAVRIASEVLFHPLFDSEAMEKERIAIIDEVTQRRDSHWHKISQYFLKQRFQKNHPLLLDGGGELDILSTLTREDLLDYWKTYFFPKNTYLLLSGNFSNGILQESLTKYFAHHTSHKTTLPFPEMKRSDFLHNHVSLRPDKKLGTCYVDVTFPSLSLCEDLMLRIKQNLALVVLGQLRNSRLFKLLRYQKGLVYDVRAGSSSYPGLGYSYASLEVGKEYLDEAVGLVADELAAFYENGPSNEELQFAKNYLISQWLMTFDHPTSISGWVESHLLWDDQILLPEDYARLITPLTTDDIVDFMHTYWDFTKLNLTIQGPIENSERNRLKYEQMLQILIPQPESSGFVPVYA